MLENMDDIYEPASVGKIMQNSMIIWTTRIFWYKKNEEHNEIRIVLLMH
jgi:hypothetical protein